jgi:hypothetical protein
MTLGLGLVTVEACCNTDQQLLKSSHLANLLHSCILFANRHVPHRLCLNRSFDRYYSALPIRSGSLVGPKPTLASALYRTSSSENVKATVVIYGVS